MLNFCTSGNNNHLIGLPDFLLMSRLWRESDIRADLANALTQSFEPLTDRGHRGLAGGVTVSCGT